MTRFLRSGRIRAALIVLAASAGVFGWALVGAMRLAPLPRAQAATVQSVAGAITAPDETDEDLVDDAVANDPFQASRQAPAARYGAADIPVTVQDAGAAQERRGSLRLLGTVIDRNGASFALCQLDDAQIKMIHAGQRVGSYRLRSISPGGAVFDGDDGAHLELHVSRTGN